MLTGETVGHAEKLVLLIRAATGQISDSQVNVTEERLATKATRIKMIIGIAEDIYNQARAELETWQGMDDILSGEGHE